MNKEMTLIPYLHFQGNCEEALKTYERIFSGSIEGIKCFGEGPMEVPETYKNKVLHGLLHFGDNSIMASDTFPGASITRGENVVLSIGLKNDDDNARRIFNELANGGKVIMPLEKQFWGALFGQLEDRFGVRWMVGSES